jgi:hypothetical protein
MVNNWDIMEREKIEAQWDIDMKDKSKSSFTFFGSHSEEGDVYCFNAKKYLLQQAIEIIEAESKLDFTNVAKSFVRYRCGSVGEGRVYGWWWGDNERGYHSVPAWKFCNNPDYPTVEEALAKERRIE